MQKQEDIHIIATGGTIDSTFYPPTESSKVKENSGIESFLDNIVAPHFNFTFEQLCMVDSSDITNHIREQIIEKISNNEKSKFLITHGTNTMQETLDYLSKKIESSEKTVILTGSMIPLDGFAATDAGFNLGYAIGQLENVKPGVYLAMNGNLFSQGEAKKNFDIARFEIVQD